jgi:hypothetical protein
MYKMWKTTYKNEQNEHFLRLCAFVGKVNSRLAPASACWACRTSLTLQIMALMPLATVSDQAGTPDTAWANQLLWALQRKQELKMSVTWEKHPQKEGSQFWLLRSQQQVWPSPSSPKQIHTGATKWSHYSTAHIHQALSSHPALV